MTERPPSTEATQTKFDLSTPEGRDKLSSWLLDAAEEVNDIFRAARESGYSEVPKYYLPLQMKVMEVGNKITGFNEQAANGEEITYEQIEDVAKRLKILEDLRKKQRAVAESIGLELTDFDEEAHPAVDTLAADTSPTTDGDTETLEPPPTDTEAAATPVEDTEDADARSAAAISPNEKSSKQSQEQITAKDILQAVSRFQENIVNLDSLSTPAYVHSTTAYQQLTKTLAQAESLAKRHDTEPDTVFQHLATTYLDRARSTYATLANHIHEQRESSAHTPDTHASGSADATSHESPKTAEPSRTGWWDPSYRNARGSVAATEPPPTDTEAAATPVEDTEGADADAPNPPDDGDVSAPEDKPTDDSGTELATTTAETNVDKETSEDTAEGLTPEQREQLKLIVDQCREALNTWRHQHPDTLDTLPAAQELEEKLATLENALEKETLNEVGQDQLLHNGQEIKDLYFQIRDHIRGLDTAPDQEVNSETGGYLLGLRIPRPAAESPDRHAAAGRAAVFREEALLTLDRMRLPQSGKERRVSDSLSPEQKMALEEMRTLLRNVSSREGLSTYQYEKLHAIAEKGILTESLLGNMPKVNPNLIERSTAKAKEQVREKVEGTLDNWKTKMQSWRESVTTAATQAGAQASSRAGEHVSEAAQTAKNWAAQATQRAAQAAANSYQWAAQRVAERLQGTPPAPKSETTASSADATHPTPDDKGAPSADEDTTGTDSKQTAKQAASAAEGDAPHNTPDSETKATPENPPPSAEQLPETVTTSKEMTLQAFITAADGSGLTETLPAIHDLDDSAVTQLLRLLTTKIAGDKELQTKFAQTIFKRDELTTQEDQQDIVIPAGTQINVRTLNLVLHRSLQDPRSTAA